MIPRSRVEHIFGVQTEVSTHVNLPANLLVNKSSCAPSVSLGVSHFNRYRFSSGIFISGFGLFDFFFMFFISCYVWLPWISFPAPLCSLCFHRLHRYYGGSDFLLAPQCCGVWLQQDLSAYFTITSLHPVPNHPMKSFEALCSFPHWFSLCSPFNDGPSLCVGFAITQQAHHSMRPKRVHLITGCRFVSGCFPPHLTMTQLPLTNDASTLAPFADFHHNVFVHSQTH